VVVRVEPLHHLQARHIDAILLVSTAHGKVLVDGVEASLGISLGSSLDSLELAILITEDINHAIRGWEGEE
jgi:hypothetical protein